MSREDRCRKAGAVNPLRVMMVAARPTVLYGAVICVEAAGRPEAAGIDCPKSCGRSELVDPAIVMAVCAAHLLKGKGPWKSYPITVPEVFCRSPGKVQ